MKVRINTDLCQSSSNTQKYSLHLQSTWDTIKADIYNVRMGSDNDVYLSSVHTPRRGFFLTPKAFRKCILNGSITFIKGGLDTTYPK